mmetsp:Transcript_15450/g.50553  ORF Transcript_15450/g.50553 Transcript_15450/m.50553 type:complete len:110 (+) Transcript_15450:387-716(+)
MTCVTDETDMRPRRRHVYLPPERDRPIYFFSTTSPTVWPVCAPTTRRLETTPAARISSFLPSIDDGTTHLVAASLLLLRKKTHPRTSQILRVIQSAISHYQAGSVRESC